MKKLQKDDLGFSLVEIIIVVAIMSILLATVGYGLSLSDGKPAEECARKLASVIQHGRTTTMGKYRNTITVRMDSDKCIVEEKILIKEGEPEGIRSSTVGNKGVTVEYSTDNGATYVPLSSVMLRFDSGSGALKEGPTKFRISKAGTTKYVVIESLTGRVIVSDTGTS